MSDLIYAEFLKNNQPVRSEEPGQIVVTKLYGQGTPFIRYKGLNDVVSPSHKPCTCGLPGQKIKRIYGREDLALYFSDGLALLPTTISEIHGRVLYELKTNKVRHTRIFQPSLDVIEIKIVIDPKLRNIGPTVEEIFSVLKQGYKEKVGGDIEIDIKEVKEVPVNIPRVLSNVDKNIFKIKKYI